MKARSRQTRAVQHPNPQHAEMAANMYTQLLKLSAAGSLALLTACAVGPRYVTPEMALPAHYKHALSPQEPAGQWQPAQPAETALRGAWWKLFNDPALDALQDAAFEANPSLQVAWARLDKARALHRQARSDLSPQIATGLGLSRERPSPVSEGLAQNASVPYTTTWHAQAGISYEVDLFRRVANAAAGARAEMQRNAALYQSVLLALQADLAQSYFLLQELDTQRDVYARAMAMRSAAYRLLQQRHAAGDASALDVARAQAALESARSEALALDARRALAENALAVLTGKAPAAFSAPFSRLQQVDIHIPAGLPSTLLERRPDIAAAERAMAAANARVGGAQAAFFPRLALTAAAGFESAELGQLLDWSSRTFVLGPLAGAALSLPLFDGGARRAQVDHALAHYEEEVANYRHTVLNAFREVEDSLAGLRFLALQAAAQEAATSAAQRAGEFAQLRHHQGDISQLELLDAQRFLLDQQLAATQLRAQQARTVVQLIRALGGGWSRADQAPAAVGLS